jgi:ribosomal protein L23
MALFSKSKKTDAAKPVKAAKPAKAEKAEKKAVATVTTGSLGSTKDVLRAPRITEKASMLQMKGVYVFDIAPDATKRDIVTAVKKMYKVTAKSVRIVGVPEKSVRKMAQNPRHRSSG